MLIKIVCFPGWEGHCTNHRGPDHEKGHATSFYQVSAEGSRCRTSQMYLDDMLLSLQYLEPTSLSLALLLSLSVAVMAGSAQAKVRHGMLSASESCPGVT